MVSQSRSSKDGSALIVVVAELLDPVMFSPAVNDPEGTVIVIVVEDGLLITEAVTPLVPPVIVSPTVKLVEAPTVAVIVPIGYVATEEEEDSRARGCVICSTVHIFNPLFDHSAKRRFKDRLAVFASYPVRNSNPHLSKASSVISAMSRLKSTEPEVAITNSYQKPHDRDWENC